MKWSSISAYVIGLLLCIAIRSSGSSPLQGPPIAFNYLTVIPNINYGDSRQYIEHLGPVAKLNTAVPHHSHIRCKFVIETRERRTEVSFEPDSNVICYDNLCNKYEYDLMRLIDSGFNTNERTIILIAGYMSGDNVDWFDEIVSNWLLVENANIIRVGWAYGDEFIYDRAVSAVPIVAREITILLHYLATLNGKQLDDFNFANRVQIVGHSLGSHIAGFVGQDLGGKLGRITALDPAGPFFDKQERQFRLDPTDARFVDSIHTNSGQIHYMNALMTAPLSGLDWMASKLPMIGNLEKQFKQGLSRESDTAWFGINQQVSHVDYYANNGRVQPGCESMMHVCDHGRAHEIYRDLLAHETRLLTQFGAEARKNNRLLAFKSDDYESFSVGMSLNDQCPSVLDFNEHSDTVQSLAQCSLPLDLLASADELVAEFNDKFGLTGLRGASSGVSAEKYYFSTRSQRPLVGHHYLLKIHTGGNSGWSTECSIKAQLMMPNGLETNLTLLENNPQVSFDNEDSSHLSAIFVMPNKDKEPILNGITNIDQRELRRYLPERVSLQVQGSRSNSVASAVVNKVWDFFTHKSKLAGCYQPIGAIEIMPLISSQHAILGRYGDYTEQLNAESKIDRSISQVLVN